MRQMLIAAGIQGRVLDDIADVIDSCGIHRTRRRPGMRASTVNCLTTNFNDVVQIDLLLAKDK
eukprot:8036628-Heterocapsa_arctica.AAC.1